MVIVKAPVFLGLFFDHMFLKESGLCAAAAFIPPHLARDNLYLHTFFGKELLIFIFSFHVGLVSSGIGHSHR